MQKKKIKEWTEHCRRYGIFLRHLEDETGIPKERISQAIRGEDEREKIINGCKRLLREKQVLW